jgi:Ca2+-binding EF-hand superfamily protein
MEVASSPLFLQVQQRIHRSAAPRQLSEDEQAEVAFAWDKLSGGQAEVQARHVKMALRAMGFQVKKTDVAELLQGHGLPPDGGIGWQAFSEVRVLRCGVGGWRGPPCTLCTQAGGHAQHVGRQFLAVGGAGAPVAVVHGVQRLPPPGCRYTTLPSLPLTHAAPHTCCHSSCVMQVLTSKITQRGPAGELRRAFRLFDLNRTGKITLKELSLIAKQLGCDIEPAELSDMIREFDRDGDGAISEEEFRAIVNASAADDS